MYYVCEHCEAQFDFERDCEKHEAICSENPDNDDDATACRTCNRCTAEGYYDPDCKLKYAVLPRVECPDHVRAVR